MGKRGDHKALTAWQETGRYRGFALGQAIRFLDPGIIILGGGVSKDSALFLNSMREVLNNEFCFQDNLPTIRTTELGDDSVRYGVIELAGRACN